MLGSERGGGRGGVCIEYCALADVQEPAAVFATGQGGQVVDVWTYDVFQVVLFLTTVGYKTHRNSQRYNLHPTHLFRSYFRSIVTF